MQSAVTAIPHFREPTSIDETIDQINSLTVKRAQAATVYRITLEFLRLVFAIESEVAAASQVLLVELPLPPATTRNLRKKKPQNIFEELHIRKGIQGYWTATGQHLQPLMNGSLAKARLQCDKLVDFLIKKQKVLERDEMQLHLNRTEDQRQSVLNEIWRDAQSPNNFICIDKIEFRKRIERMEAYALVYPGYAFTTQIQLFLGLMGEAERMCKTSPKPVHLAGSGRT